MVSTTSSLWALAAQFQGIANTGQVQLGPSGWTEPISHRHQTIILLNILSTCTHPLRMDENVKIWLKYSLKNDTLCKVSDQEHRLGDKLLLQACFPLTPVT